MTSMRSSGRPPRRCAQQWWVRQAPAARRARGCWRRAGCRVMKTPARLGAASTGPNTPLARSSGVMSRTACSRGVGTCRPFPAGCRRCPRPCARRARFGGPRATRADTTADRRRGCLGANLSRIMCGVRDLRPLTELVGHPLECDPRPLR
jgi:hypothetical protein